MRLSSARGFLNIVLKRITRRCGVSDRYLYRYIARGRPRGARRHDGGAIVARARDGNRPRKSKAAAVDIAVGNSAAPRQFARVGHPGIVACVPRSNLTRAYVRFSRTFCRSRFLGFTSFIARYGFFFFCFKSRPAERLRVATVHANVRTPYVQAIIVRCWCNTQYKCKPRINLVVCRTRVTRGVQCCGNRVPPPSRAPGVCADS